MNINNLDRIQTKLELITRRWWFYFIFILVQFFIPSYTSKGFDWSETGLITEEILSNAIVYSYSALYPIFKIIPIILVVSIIILRNRISRIFSIYVAFTYVLFAFLQSIAETDKYGFGILTLNLIMFLVVAVFWFWEALIQKNDFTPQKRPLWKYWMIPFAIFAFWYPINPNTFMPDFNPLYIFTNEAGLAFCLMTPVYLSILTLYHPKVNIATLRVTSLVGLIIGFYNILVNFFMSPETLWWNGVLHIPLFTISIYSLVLSFKG